MKVRSAPSVTRVHTLHRIRTVVNHVTELVDQGITSVDDLAVADHLIKTHLSKPTTKKIRDQVGRRARDHLETARYLGLLYRKKDGAKFAHAPTDWGRGLSKYKIRKECPNDPAEEAIFVDRLCRLKIANASYLQEGDGPYTGFRGRLCLNILSSLKASGGLSIYQLGFILADAKVDTKVSPTRLEKLTKRVMSRTYQATYEGKLSAKDRRNVNRDTRPFVDWCKQLGLVERVTESDTIVLTERGEAALDFYSRSLPIWWPDLNYWAELAAAGILLVNYLKLRKQGKVLKKLMRVEGKSGLFAGRVGDVLRDVTGCSVKQICNGEMWFDFSLSYDVPPERWTYVEQTLQELLAKLAMKSNVTVVLNTVEWESIKRWQRKFKEEADYASELVSSKLRVRATIPTASIQYHFQSDYEAASYVLLQHLQKHNFSIAKYQGQLMEYFADDPYWRHVASSNPDLLITDGFVSLVECKSVKEWGPKLVLTKHIVGELLLYSQFAEAVTGRAKVTDRCRAVFSYEGEVDEKGRGAIEKFLEDQCPCVIVVLRKALQRALIDTSEKKALRGLMAQARGYRRLSNRVIG